ncbi:bestrophin [Roseomonas sp. OT10]|uniref:bestrophin family protein n=1 Tax=Roseomonas cutis TaxID=2897332 RepID=UPI001E60DF0A|nr:bestrophin family ion channel [Roseomonas sp. OT10]UFN47016.1 bestrophin [Roseomonas sp. OT10]
MIVRPRPRAFDLLFALRGSIVPLIAPQVGFVAGLSLVLAFLDRRWPQHFPELTTAPFSVLALTLSIFLGFRNNTCYARWWEARQLWGLLVTESRCLAREVVSLLPGDASRQRRVLRRQIGFAHCLAARLRDGDGAAAARPWLEAAEAAALATRRNPGAALLRAQSEEFAAALRDGHLGEVLFGMLEARLNALSLVQAGAERIRHTPTPYAYSLLLHRSAWLFCLLLPFGYVGTLGFFTPLVTGILAYTLFGLDALSDELEEPFGLAQNDLPLDALVRVVEIDLLEALGEPDLPEPARPVRYVLT